MSNGSKIVFHSVYEDNQGIDFTPIYDIKQQIEEKIFETEEKFIIQIVSEYLKHPVLPEDGKRCQIIRHVDFHDRYIIAVDNNQLGMVKKSINFGDVGFEFIPGQITFNNA